MEDQSPFRPPIVVAEGLDILTFATVADAEAHLEGADVARGQIVVFDANGYRLRAVAVDAQTARIARGPSLEREDDTLRPILVRYAELTSLGVTVDIEGMSSAPISEVIRVVYEYQHQPVWRRVRRWLRRRSQGPTT